VFDGLPKNHFGAILADPPWHFKRYSEKHSEKSRGRAPQDHYSTMTDADIAAMPVADLASDNCVLFLWAVWPKMDIAFRVIDAWGFTYKTCAFCWLKGDPYRLWADEQTPSMLMGYWTRSNSEACLLATRGKPSRQDAGVRQGIIAPRREHSRKPDGIHERIERLVAGPYLELFARAERPGWTVWGNETTKFGKLEAAE
jgi:N6-adenosine-specific RNA methylase IME4